MARRKIGTKLLPDDDVDTALKAWMDDIRSAAVPTGIMALAETLEHRLDEIGRTPTDP